MKRLIKKAVYMGKKIKFLEDVPYAVIDEMNYNGNTACYSGIEYNGKVNEKMNQEEFDELEEYLNSNGFIKGSVFTIPEGAVGTVVGETLNDVDLQLTDKLKVVLINYFVTDPAKKGEEDILVEFIQ